MPKALKMTIILILGKQKRKFFLHKKFFLRDHFKRLFSLEIEFGDIDPQIGIIEHHLFMKKEKWFMGQFFK
jgi:hypothetical protein